MAQPAFPDVALPEKRSFVVMVQELLSWQELHCMHWITKGEEFVLSCCDQHAEVFCVACGRPICDAHVAERPISLGDQTEEETFLCLACSELTDYDLKAIRALRLGLRS